MGERKAKETAKAAKIVNQSENTEVFVRTNAGRSHGKASKAKIFITFGVIIAILAGLGYFMSTRNTEHRAIVSVGSVELMDLEETVSIRGTIQGSDSADVSSALNYKITAIYVKEGDIVKKDQVLATLDVSDLQDQYNKAALALRESTRAYESAEALYVEGAMAREEYLRLKAAYDGDKLNMSTFNIADKRNVKSPISGTVTRVNVNVGRYASDTEKGQAMFVVENLGDLQMKVRIGEYDISKIKVGQTVTITADVLGKESVTGIVSSISPTGEEKDMTSSEKVIPVVIDIDKSDKNLIAGVTAKATILIDRRENVPAISIDAIIQDPETGENLVFVVDEDEALRKVAVELGLETNIYAEILEGALKEGEQVVLAPSFELEDGMLVTVNTPLR
ncbi:MAG: efflux RND transporter periplasmic adaptor subunit [Clostridiales bacterium]|nr:efflux RND transporter periplasmic adaptor subunit [Clostridiales bacterium]